MATTLTVNIADYQQWRHENEVPNPALMFTTSPDTDSVLHPLIVTVEVPKLFGKKEFSFVSRDLMTMTSDLSINHESELVGWLNKAGIQFVTA
ncbi:MAG: hypothetical protein V4505_13910 [Pseudomonadota bacterium]